MCETRRYGRRAARVRVFRGLGSEIRQTGRYVRSDGGKRGGGLISRVFVSHYIKSRDPYHPNECSYDLNPATSGGGDLSRTFGGSREEKRARPLPPSSPSPPSRVTNYSMHGGARRDFLVHGCAASESTMTRDITRGACTQTHTYTKGSKV